MPRPANGGKDNANSELITGGETNLNNAVSPRRETSRITFAFHRRWREESFIMNEFARYVFSISRRAQPQWYLP